MQQYTDLVQDVLVNGQVRQDRTGVGTIGVFGRTLNFDLGEGFPIVTVKETNFKAIAAELVGFIRGFDSAKQFRDAGTKIWDANANAPGLEGHRNPWLNNPVRKGEDDLGRIYGVQWRGWKGPARPEPVREPHSGEVAPADGWWGPGLEVDQLDNLLHDLASNPYSRRHLVTAWNPGELDQMALPPCHYAFQCYMREDGQGGFFLDMMVHMRSVDVFLGLPFNISSYAALTHWIAHMVTVWGNSSGRVVYPGRLIMTLGDTHIYLNHVNAAKLMLTRNSKWRCAHPADAAFLMAPRLTIDPELDSYEKTVADSFILMGYYPHKPIRVPMAV